MVEEFSIQLDLLADILRRKKQALEQIANITENQETVLSQPKSKEFTEMFNQMASEKQKYVEIVLQSDTYFQNVFDSVKENFEQMAEICLPKIKTLQDLIKEVMDLDVAIRVKEQKNKELVNSRKAIKHINMPRASKDYMLKQYSKNKTQK